MNLLPNLGLPTAAQYQKILGALIFSFISGFLATLIAQGGIVVGLGWEGLISLIGGCLVSGINTALYFTYVTFFKK